MEGSFLRKKKRLAPEDEPMNIHELMQQAQGLEQTALNAVNAGQGEQRPQSIVRDAARRLVTAKASLNGSSSHNADAVYPEMTWTEVLALARLISAWAAQHAGQEAAPAPAAKPAS